MTLPPSHGEPHLHRDIHADKNTVEPHPTACVRGNDVGGHNLAEAALLRLSLITRVEDRLHLLVQLVACFLG